MNNKIIIKSKSEFNKWLDIANLFAKSMCSYNEVLRQFHRIRKKILKFIWNNKRANRDKKTIEYVR